MTALQPTIHVYTDGACSGNPGPIGVGVVVYVEHGAVVHSRHEIAEHRGVGTNQQAELMAVAAGVGHVAATHGTHHAVAIYSDSEYAIGLLSKGWHAKANTTLVESVRATCRRFPRLRFVKVRGHAGDVNNERADELARAAVRKGSK